MNKINFQNLPSTGTPVNATNLNQLQTNVENDLNTRVGLKGSFSSATDLDNITSTGVYCTANVTLTNAPTTNYSWAHLIVLDEGIITQFFVKGNTDEVYYRIMSGSPLTWKSWNKVGVINKYTSTLTLSNTYNNETLRNYINRVEKTVFINLIFETKAQIPTWTTFATVPSGYRTDSTQAGVRGILWDYNGNVYPIEVQENGNIRTCDLAIPANVILQSSITYFTE